MEFSTIRGFKDILPEESERWQGLESEVRRVFRVFGFREIRPPILETTELFSRGIGQETDIVSKEMYSLTDNKGRSLTLRPEATASVARAYIQHRLYDSNPVQKLYTIGPMFRHERPQKGRLRQFHQINAEVFGDAGPKSDADVVILAVHLLEAVGLTELQLYLNSLGCPLCRAPFKRELKTYLSSQTEGLCMDCQRRTETNPLRVFDCKVPGCKEIVDEAPSIPEFLCGDCRDHFQALQGYLVDAGIPFAPDPKLVRGLDYYSRTTFEIQTEHLGAQNAVTGGGRYDGLVKLLGGPDHPAIGFAVGMERVIALLGGGRGSNGEGPDLFIAALGPQAEKASLCWAAALRKGGIWVEMDYATRGLKAQMKRADRLGAKRVFIVGDDELRSGRGILRDMNTKSQEELALDRAVQELLERLR